MVWCDVVRGAEVHGVPQLHTGPTHERREVNSEQHREHGDQWTVETECSVDTGLSVNLCATSPPPHSVQWSCQCYLFNNMWSLVVTPGQSTSQMNLKQIYITNQSIVKVNDKWKVIAEQTNNRIWWTNIPGLDLIPEQERKIDCKTEV